MASQPLSWCKAVHACRVSTAPVQCTTTQCYHACHRQLCQAQEAQLATRLYTNICWCKLDACRPCTSRRCGIRSTASWLAPCSRRSWRTCMQLGWHRRQVWLTRSCTTARLLECALIPPGPARQNQVCCSADSGLCQHMWPGTGTFESDTVLYLIHLACLQEEPSSSASSAGSKLMAARQLHQGTAYWQQSAAKADACCVPACRCQPHETGGSTFHCTPWIRNDFPFGSEFAWDSTGQEEIYTWAK